MLQQGKKKKVLYHIWIIFYFISGSHRNVCYQLLLLNELSKSFKINFISFSLERVDENGQYCNEYIPLLNGLEQVNPEFLSKHFIGIKVFYLCSN